LVRSLKANETPVRVHYDEEPSALEEEGQHYDLKNQSIARSTDIGELDESINYEKK